MEKYLFEVCFILLYFGLRLALNNDYQALLNTMPQHILFIVLVILFSFCVRQFKDQILKAIKTDTSKDNTSKDDTFSIRIVKRVFIHVWLIVLYVGFRVVMMPHISRQDMYNEATEKIAEHIVFILIIITVGTFADIFRYQVITTIKQSLRFEGIKNIVTETVNQIISKEKLLEIPIEDYLFHLPKNTCFYAVKIVRDRLTNSINCLKHFGVSLKFNVDSSDLYKYIRASLADRHTCREFFIIDHDINRWRELNSEVVTHTSNAGNTFNYSNEILQITFDRGTTVNHEFSLKRIFVINENEWRELACQDKSRPCSKQCSNHNNCAVKSLGDGDSGDLLKIVSKIAEVERDINNKDQKRVIETRICVFKWLQNSHYNLSKELERLCDIFVVDERIIFREHFHVLNRSGSEITTSEISCHEQDVSDCIKLFNEIWSKCTKVLHSESASIENRGQAQ